MMWEKCSFKQFFNREPPSFTLLNSLMFYVIGINVLFDEHKPIFYSAVDAHFTTSPVLIILHIKEKITPRGLFV